LHLRECAACRSYREEVRNQRKVLAAALPVVPSVGLKSSVLAALGLGSGSAGGGLAVGLSSVAGAFGGGALVKVAVVGVLAGGTAIAVPGALESRREAPAPNTGAEKQPSQRAGTGLQAAVQGSRRTPGLQPLSTPDANRAGHAKAGAGADTPRPAVPPASTKRPTHGPSPGQAKPLQGTAPPPGQARKGDASAPPGQAKKAGHSVPPPGQARLGRDGAPGNGAHGAEGGNSAQGAKLKAPERPAPKVEDQAPAAPALGNSVPAPPPVEKSKHKIKP
jgi:hypothetical protein